ncbi:MAG: DUF5115 domain-containing protein [Prevotella sp.]|nr:DUF5115 domain-containing protein [Prevotella sp.]
MKKLIYMVGLVAMLASCSGDYTDWATPQSNSEEASKTVTLQLSNATAIDYATLTADSVQLFVPTITSDDVVVSTYTALLYNADNTQSVTLSANAQGMVAATDLKTAVEQLYGKTPEAHTIPLTVTALSNDQGVSIKNVGETSATVTLEAPFIDSAYYLVGDMVGWDKSKAVALTHVGTGNVYDDPEFTIVFKTTADNQYWKLIPQTNYDGEFWASGETGVVGVTVDGDDATSGNLTTTNPGAGKIPNAGYHRLTINMMTYTYTIEDLNFAEFIYETGNNTGWNNGLAMYGPNFDGKYYGAFYLDGEFKFKPNSANWDGDWEYNGDGKLDANGQGNIPAPTTGFYFVTVDLSAMTYSLKSFTEMHVVGDALNGNSDQWGAGVTMTWNATDKTWEATGVKLDAGKSIKFKDEDSSWSGVNLGGQLDKLVQGSNDNISVTTGGTYNIILHMENTDRAPYAELIAQ